MGGHPGTITTQTGFRGRTDTFAEATDDGWFAPTNTDWIADTLNSKFRVRFILDYGTRGSVVQEDYTIRYSHNEDVFVQVTDTSSVLRIVNSDVGGYVHGDDTTQLIGFSGQFFVTNNNLVMTESLSEIISVPNPEVATETELEAVLQYVPSDLQAGDTIELRVFTRIGSVLTGGYDFFPIISVPEIGRRIFIS